MRLGDRPRSWEHLREALRIFIENDTASGIARALGMAAIVQASSAIPELAARIAGTTVRAGAGEVGDARPGQGAPPARPADLVREALGEERANALMAEGAATPVPTWSRGCSRRRRRSADDPYDRDVLSDLQAGPPLGELVRSDAVHDDQLLAARRAGHEPHVAACDPELVGEESDERLVRGALDRRGGHPDAEHAVDHTFDTVRQGSRCEADGEARFVLGQGTRYRTTRIRKPRTSSTIRLEKSNMPVCGIRRRTGARIGSVAWMRKTTELRAAHGIDPAHQDPPEDEQPQDDEDQSR